MIVDIVVIINEVDNDVDVGINLFNFVRSLLFLLLLVKVFGINIDDDDEYDEEEEEVGLIKDTRNLFTAGTLDTTFMARHSYSPLSRREEARTMVRCDTRLENNDNK